MGSVGPFYEVHVGLAMKSTAMHGCPGQTERWLPPMARLERIGAFSLTKPEPESDCIAVETPARRDGDEPVLDGGTRGVGNGTIAGVVVVWAPDTADGPVNGFAVEKGTQGYQASVMEGRTVLHPVRNVHIERTTCRVPDANRLPGATSGKDAGSVLAGTRNTVAWGAPGHGVAACEFALACAEERRPTGLLIEEGRSTDPIAALGRLNNTVKARVVCATTGEILGGNSVLLRHHVARQLSDVAALYTYEGTAKIPARLVGRAITGVGAFA